MSLAAAANILGDDEVQSYRDKGFLVPAFRLQGRDLERLQKLTASVIAANPHLENKPIPQPNCPSFRRHGVEADGALMEFAARPDLVDIVEQLIGPDIILWSSTIFHKPAATGKRTPWHRDGEFWPIDPLATVSLWIATTESRTSNGCLRVIPGSHLANDMGRHHDVTTDDVIFGREIDADQFDEDLAYDIELEPGQMVLFDSRMIHGATPNSGRLARTGFSARYMPTTSRFLHGTARMPTVKEDGFALGLRPLFLLRGIDRAGNDLARNVCEEDVAALGPWLARAA